MEYRTLGNTGVKVSELCLGSMQFLWTASEQASISVLDAFYSAGGNFIDTANIYSNWAEGMQGGNAESLIGRWLKSRKVRHKIVLATKVRGKMWEGKNGEGLGREHIISACEDSLWRLGVDAIDLYQSHWPDGSVQAEETLAAYKDLVQQGKVRFIGCSNFSAEEMEKAHMAGEKIGLQYISNQPRYNLIHRSEFESRDLPFILKHKMAVLPYSPLAEGFLTGKYKKNSPLPISLRQSAVVKRSMNDSNLEVVDALAAMAVESGKTVAQISLAWVLSHDWISAPIIGANGVEQLKENLGCSGFKLSSNQIERLNVLTANL